MRKLQCKSVKVVPVIGVGFYTEVYDLENNGIEGYSYIIFIPFIKITITVLDLPNKFPGHTNPPPPPPKDRVIREGKEPERPKIRPVSEYSEPKKKY